MVPLYRRLAQAVLEELLRNTWLLSLQLKLLEGNRLRVLLAYGVYFPYGLQDVLSFERLLLEGDNEYGRPGSAAAQD